MQVGLVCPMSVQLYHGVTEDTTQEDPRTSHDLY